MGQPKPPCFGSPDPRSPGCRECGVRDRCFKEAAQVSEVFMLPLAKSVVAKVRKHGVAYVDEKPGMKPWEKPKPEEKD